MKVRSFRIDDAPALAGLSAACARSEGDFVLNPLWESESDLFAEFDRFGIDPGSHLLVAAAGDAEIHGLAGFLRQPDSDVAGLICPIVKRGGRGRGVGGELLRAALTAAAGKLKIRFVGAGIGTRNRAGYSLLSSHGFRPVRQHFLMRCDAKPSVPRVPIGDLALDFAGSDDTAAIGALYEACGFDPRSSETLRSLLLDGRHSHAVARHEGRVVAFAEIETHWPRRVWVAYVGVENELRDRGVGSALVAWSLERHFEAGATSALLLLSPANRTALRAYEKVGFRRFRLIDVLEKNL